MQAWIPVSLTPSSILRRRCAALCWARTVAGCLAARRALACGADPAQQAVAQLVQLSGSAGEAAAACASAIRELGDGPFPQLNAMACVVDPAFNEDILPAQAWLLAVRRGGTCGRRAAVRREAARRRGRLRGVAGGSAGRARGSRGRPRRFPGVCRNRVAHACPGPCGLFVLARVGARILGYAGLGPSLRNVGEQA